MELARQSAIVPAACLGALLLAVVIAVAACLATRRRRQRARRRRNVGMGTEGNQSDKTTLLTEGSEVED
ncbi:Hypothetical predicted protein [Cloeon dipterum]|uniref:Uncharacterized protein n=1 Tax=Cloeon dipterum TaxID=197152 RepID=A0A8S1E5G7_9INSE|nr:Hypothetical predicted protein [Cloeon dipterum]